MAKKIKDRDKPGGLSKMIHEDIRKFTDYTADGDKLKWKIKNSVYEFKDGGVKTDYPLLVEEIDEDEETGILTCGAATTPFCPRGYFVAGTWCPIAEIAFAVHRNNPGSTITIYDEVM